MSLPRSGEGKVGGMSLGICWTRWRRCGLPSLLPVSPVPFPGTEGVRGAQWGSVRYQVHGKSLYHVSVYGVRWGLVPLATQVVSPVGSKRRIAARTRGLRAMRAGPTDGTAGCRVPLAVGGEFWTLGGRADLLRYCVLCAEQWGWHGLSCS